MPWCPLLCAQWACIPEDVQTDRCLLMKMSSCVCTPQSSPVLRGACLSHLNIAGNTRTSLYPTASCIAVGSTEILTWLPTQKETSLDQCRLCAHVVGRIQWIWTGACVTWALCRSYACLSGGHCALQTYMATWKCLLVRARVCLCHILHSENS